MKFEKYFSGLYPCLVEVSRVRKQGVMLSRRGMFDYLFKKELAILTGQRKDTTLRYKFVMNMKNIDYRIAKFYADSFYRLYEFIEEGYNNYDLEDFIYEIVRTARRKGFFPQKLDVTCVDKNSKFYVVIKNNKGDKETFVVDSVLSMAECVLSLVSFLGSLYEEDLDDRRWLNKYLFKVMYDIRTEVAPRGYAEYELNYKTYIEELGTERLVALP